MQNIINTFEKIFTAVAFAESGEFEMAKKIMNECHAQSSRYSQSNSISMDRLNA